MKQPLTSRGRDAQPHRRLLVLVLALLAGTTSGAWGCGEGESDVERQPAGSSAGAQATDFPRPSSRSLRELTRNMPQGPELVPSVSLLEPGRNRFAFVLFDRGSRQIGDLDVALYFSQGLDETAHGPYPARFEPIAVDDRYVRSETRSDGETHSLYVTNVRLASVSSYTAVAISKLGGRWVASTPTELNITRGSRVPRVGDRAIRAHSRSLATALAAQRPALVLFSAPGRCRSRVCVPISEIAEQVKSELSRRIEFVHTKIYRDGDPSKGVHPQVGAWHLPSAPFAFAIDSRGRVASRLEGAFSARELVAAARTALRQ